VAIGHDAIGHLDAEPGPNRDRSGGAKVDIVRVGGNDQDLLDARWVIHKRPAEFVFFGPHDALMLGRHVNSAPIGSLPKPTRTTPRDHRRSSGESGSRPLRSLSQVGSPSSHSIGPYMIEHQKRV